MRRLTEVIFALWMGLWAGLWAGLWLARHLESFRIKWVGGRVFFATLMARAHQRGALISIRRMARARARRDALAARYLALGGSPSYLPELYGEGLDQLEEIPPESISAPQDREHSP